MGIRAIRITMEQSLTFSRRFFSKARCPCLRRRQAHPAFQFVVPDGQTQALDSGLSFWGLSFLAKPVFLPHYEHTC
jgi:hypothetical protein